MSRFIVGVSGGIGSGKTTVTDAFAQFGIEIVDADVIAREVVEPGSDALGHIQQHFGDEILLSDGGLDRAALRQRIFADETQKAWLNQLLHPLIRQRIEAQLEAATSPYAILSAPLLLENKLTHLCDRVLIIDVSEATQVQRTVARDHNNKDQVRAIMRSQVSRDQRLAVADDVIDNNGSPEATLAQVRTLHQRYLTLAGSQPG